MPFEVSARLERAIAVLDVIVVAGSFAIADHLEWAGAIVIAGVVTAPAIVLWPADVPVTPAQLAWLGLSGVVAVQFAFTGVGPASGFVVWFVAYAAWLFYRVGVRARERQSAKLTPSAVIPASSARWPVIVSYGRGRTAAFRIATAFFACTFLSSLWLLFYELSRSDPGIGVLLTASHVLVVAALVFTASRAAERITLDADRIELIKVFGGTVVATWAEITEVRIVRWVPQGMQPPQLRLVNALGHALVALDLGDKRQRALLPLVRGRLPSAPWRTERRASWI